MLAGGRRIGRRAAALLAALAAASAVVLPPPAAADDFVRLSNERTRTYSADVLRAVLVRKAPSPGAPRLSRLRTVTYHGSPEVVVVLGVRTVGARPWAYVRYSGLGSRRGWVPLASLSSVTRHSTRLVLDRSRLRLSLFRGERLLFRARVGIGAMGSPTPAGRYYVRERLGPFRNTNSTYGALAFGTSAFTPQRTDWPGGGQVGIHGTNQGWLIPGRISNGCVRLTNPNVLRLARLLEVGAPLLVR